MTHPHASTEKYDLICVGGGIMSATLSLMLKLLDPKASILILEKLDQVAQESTEAWNNSGTGHSAFCELNYTPEKADGSIDIGKAVDIFEQYERSKQLWSFLLEEKLLADPSSFIHSVPHHAWVEGEQDVTYLKKRFEALQSHFAFEHMQFSDEAAVLKQWFPLIMEGRHAGEVMAATPHGIRHRGKF